MPQCPIAGDANTFSSKIVFLFPVVMGDSAKKKTIRFDSVPQTSRFDSIHCKQETNTKSQTSW